MSNYFSGLSNEEIINELLNINNELLQSTKGFCIKSVILWLNSIRETVKNNGQNMTNLQSYTMNTCDRIEDLILSEDSREKKLSELRELREKLHSDFVLLNSYHTFAINTFEYINFLVLKSLTNDDNVVGTQKNDIDNLIKQIVKTLEKLKSKPEKYFKLVKDIIGELPMRSTKAKVLEIIKISLYRSAFRKSDYFIQNDFKILNGIVNYNQVDGYGKNFDDIYSSIKDISEINNSTESTDNIKLALDKIKEIIIGIRYYLQRFKEMGISINQFMTNLLITEFENDSYTASLILTYKDLSDEKKVLFLEKLEKLLLEDAKYQNNKIESFNTINKSILERNDINLDGINSVLTKTKDYLKYYNDAYFLSEEDLDKDLFKLLSEEEFNNKLEDFIENLSSGIEKFDGIKRKIVMRRLLSELEIPFINLNEFLDYVELSLSDKSMGTHFIEAKIMIIENILKKSLN